MKVSIIIPTYNGGELLEKCLKSIEAQDCFFAQKIIIDSSSKDNTLELAGRYGFETYVIDQKDFDHGGTRNEALGKVTSDIVVYMTQDAILETSKAVSHLIEAFRDPEVDAVYGRQLPHLDANYLAKYARINSYKDLDYTTSLNDEFPIGFRKAFMSNSFAAYRVVSLRELGGFPSKLILGEDSFVAAKTLLKGRKVSYKASAVARHSHNYTISQEFKRYFDIGVFHKSQSWMLDSLGRVEGEGIKFALGQIKYLWKMKVYTLIPLSLLMSFAKFSGYKLGKNYNKLSTRLNIKLSMHKGYFKG